MKLLGKKMLYDFKEKHADAGAHIDSWAAEVEEAQWNTPQELKLRYPKASILKNLRVVFDLCWNKYRLLVRINYKNKIALVEKIGTHKEYNKWNLN
jgi:mRNA interferase HigB